MGHTPPGEEMTLLAEAVVAAGEVAERCFAGKVRCWTKADGTPVSEADLAVNEALEARLRKARPDYGWISEEAEPDREPRRRNFVVDPIDGTNAFLDKSRQWTVVASIIEDGRPLAAAIHQPLTNTTYQAARGEGAFREGKRLKVSDAADLPGAHLAIPGPLFREGFARTGARKADKVRSLALQLAMVGGAEFDAAVTKPGPHHWDLAAADLIVHEAGGTFTTLTGAALRYDLETTSHRPAVAGPQALASLVRELAARHQAAR